MLTDPGGRVPRPDPQSLRPASTRQADGPSAFWLNFIADRPQRHPSDTAFRDALDRRMAEIIDRYERDHDA